MPDLRPRAEKKFYAFLTREWPLSWSYFAQLTTGNSYWLERFIHGGELSIDTADAGLDFIDDYRIDPEGTMRKARAALAARIAARRFVKPTRKNKQAKKARAA